MMMGIKVKPDSKYLTHDTVTSVNNLVGAIQGVACHFVPELTDENIDAMLDAMGVPKTGSTPCAQLIAEIDAIYGDGRAFINTHSQNIPPNLRPVVQNIGKDLHTFSTNIVRGDCDANGQITRASLRASTKARMSALCNFEQ